MMKKTTRLLVKILTFLILVMGTMELLQLNTTIIKTGVSLIVLRDNCSYYSEQSKKTDELISQYAENNAKRQAIYYSDDAVVRIYSNQNVLVKLIGIIFALLSYLLIPCIWVGIITRKIRIIRRRVKKLKKKNQKNVTRKGVVI